MIGFDIERHEYGQHRYPGLLVVQDARTLHGSQLRRASLLVASPPCQEPSYRAMPWKKAKALNAAGPPVKFIELFETCFRLQREACEAAGRHIPLIVENVRGAQKWVGRARWAYGSFYLWGDVPALMPITFAAKVGGFSWSNHGKLGYKAKAFNGEADRRLREEAGVKCGGDWFGDNNPSAMRHHSSKSSARKMASAMIAKIPLPLGRHIAATFWPQGYARFPT